MRLINKAKEIAKEEGLPTLIRVVLRRIIASCLCKLMVKKIVVRNILGSKMVLALTEGGVHSELFVYGTREKPALKYFTTILKPDITVVDIGANIGYYALLEAKMCKKVYAIEPAPDNYRMLQGNIKINNYNNITAHRMAIGDREGDVHFKLSHIPNWHRVASNGDGDVVVPLMTLDTFLDGQKVDLVRMDVEGYELNILKGMCRTIEANNLWLFIETHHKLIEEYGGSLRELYELLASYDFMLTYSVIRNKPSVSGRLRELVDNDKLYQGLGSWLFLKKGE